MPSIVEGLSLKLPETVSWLYDSHSNHPRLAATRESPFELLRVTSHNVGKWSDWCNHQTVSELNARCGDVWAANDQLTLRNIDNGADGIVDTRISAEYTDFGKLRRHRYDAGADGIIEYTNELDYDSLERRTRMEFRGIAAQNGGTRIDDRFDCPNDAS